MKGNAIIAEILQKAYGIKDLTGYEEIEYEIQHFTDEISRVKIKSTSGTTFCCPVYAVFDGYHMSWYGDYGSFVFDCTWKTNVMNLAYESPYYQLEKLDSRDREEFDGEECLKRLLKLIKEGDWYNYDLDEVQKKRFDEFISDRYGYISYYDDPLSEHKDTCDKLAELRDASQDGYDWVTKLRHINFEEDLYNVFGCEEYELYSIGNKAPLRFFIILYLLSVVANMESEDAQ